ncbi:MAG TPA: hypothetical protein PK411_11365 [Mesotoga infera]|nr:hypothetical protein [Mesotoga infera]
MATTTTNHGLTKPAGTDNVDISVINGNMDKIDQMPVLYRAASEPTNKVSGKTLWYDTANLMLKLWNGSSWDTVSTAAVATTSVSGLMSASDKSKLDGVAANANNYVHPTDDGNKHIPAGGSSGQFLKYSAAGTATWSTVTKSDVGLGSVSNYGIATQAEAEAGTSSTKYMTPLRTAQAIAALQAVKSVAGKTGEVTLSASDVGAAASDDAGLTTRSSTAPSNPVEGQLWYDTANDKLKVYDGSAWVAAGGTTYNDDQVRKITISTSDPSGGSDGDIWIKY